MRSTSPRSSAGHRTDSRRRDDEAIWVGLISGTSRDAIEACALRVADADTVAGTTPRPIAILHRRSEAYPRNLRDALDALLAADAGVLGRIAEIDARIGEAFARAVAALLDEAGLSPSDIAGIGHHGQTLHHGAGHRASGTPHYSWQIGDPFRLAEAIKRPVWHDFRRADIAAGGEGAPLACALHDVWLRHADEGRVVLNLGGIANATLLFPGQPLLGFDTGPANTLLDGHIRRALGHDYDDAGAWAASGRVHDALLDLLMQDPYLVRPAPKSTGIEYFSTAWLERCLDMAGLWVERDLSAADLQATLAEFTAASVANAVTRAAAGQRIDRVLVCGGGVFNTDLMARLTRRFNATAKHSNARVVVVESTAAHGLDPLAVEAATFAWLAASSEAGFAGNRPDVTGARGHRVLGSRIEVQPGARHRNAPL